MPLYIMATRLMREDGYAALHSEEKEGRLMRAMRDAWLKIEWIGSYATLGPYDYLDIFHAPDMKEAQKFSTVVRGIGGAQTEIWSALEWQQFRKMLTELQDAA